jgi:hypothetical protein
MNPICTPADEEARETHRVDLEVPRLARLAKVDRDLLELEAQLGERNMSAVGPRTEAVGVAVSHIRVPFRSLWWIRRASRWLIE